MLQTLDASQLTLPQVHQHLNLRAHFAPDLSAHLHLQPLPETDSLQNLSQLAKSYYLQDRLLEGQASCSSRPCSGSLASISPKSASISKKTSPRSS